MLEPVLRTRCGQLPRRRGSSPSDQAILPTSSVPRSRAPSRSFDLVDRGRGDSGTSGELLQGKPASLPEKPDLRTDASDDVIQRRVFPSARERGAANRLVYYRGWMSIIVEAPSPAVWSSVRTLVAATRTVAVSQACASGAHSSRRFVVTGLGTWPAQAGGVHATLPSHRCSRSGRLR